MTLTCDVLVHCPQHFSFSWTGLSNLVDFDDLVGLGIALVFALV